MEDLPLEIQSKILSYVPLDYAVLSCKFVSKTWKTLLSHRKLVGGLLFYINICGGVPKLRFGHYDDVLNLPWADDSAEDQDPNKCVSKTLTKIKHPISKNEVYRYNFIVTDLIGSCNGLVCISIRLTIKCRNSAPIYHVLNPLTGEYFNLPTTIDDGKTGVVSGFGYDPSSDSYKIVCIQYCEPSNEKGSVQVYTLGGVGSSIGWRNIGEINHKREGILRTDSSECVFWNGSLHWLDRHQWKIVAFDLADEKFHSIPITNKHTYSQSKIYYSYYQAQLKLLGEYLSIVDVGYTHINIWSFKNTNQNDDILGYESWNWGLEFSIPTFPSPHKSVYDIYADTDSIDRYEVFAITKNNEVLLWHYTFRKDSFTIRPILLCRYDPKTDTLNKVVNLKFHNDYMFQGIPHVNSLVSLKLWE